MDVTLTKTFLYLRVCMYLYKNAKHVIVEISMQRIPSEDKDDVSSLESRKSLQMCIFVKRKPEECKQQKYNAKHWPALLSLVLFTALNCFIFIIFMSYCIRGYKIQPVYCIHNLM